MSLSSSLLSPESALRFPSSLGKEQSKCRGRAAVFMGAALSSARHLPVHSGHGGIMQSSPHCQPGPRLPIGGCLWAERVWGCSKYHSYPEFNQGTQASFCRAGDGSEFCPGSPFSPVPRKRSEMSPICFLFECKVSHTLEKTWAGDSPSCFGGKVVEFVLGCTSSFGECRSPRYKPTCLNLFRTGENTVCCFSSVCKQFAMLLPCRKMIAANYKWCF